MEEEKFKNLQKQVSSLQQENNQLKKQLEKFQPQIKPFKQNPEKLQKLFESCKKQKYALKLAYIGINYSGIEFQKEQQNTIEYYLFNAFKKTCLVENTDDMSLVDYSRSGRTDRGVSAVGNVVALNLRTSIKKNNQQQQEQQELQEQQQYLEQKTEIDNQDSQKQTENNRQNQQQNQIQEEEENTLDYVKMLNGVLPKDIRVLAATRVRDDFNARFDCDHRVYKYFFIRNNMDIEKLNEAAQLLIGEHDFRNFCKIDVLQTTNYIRKILEIKTELIQKNEQNPDLDMFCITIKGTAFLWHMIRCIMSILFMVGEQKETPQIVKQLLDINRFNGRPQYDMASDLPLILYDCVYKDIDFKYQQQDVFKLYENYKKILVDRQIESNLYNISMQFLLTRDNYYQDKQKIEEGINMQKQVIEQQRNQEAEKKHQKLTERMQCDNAEEQIKKLKGKKLEQYNNKLEKIEKKRKLEQDANQK